MASEAQAVRYEQLLAMQESGQIERLRVEVSYPLIVAGVKIATYRADADYFVIDRERQIERHLVEEVKGMETPEWKLKCKLFRALYPYLELHVIMKISGTKAWEAEPLAEQMVGKKSSFAEWIKLRWAATIPT